MFQGQKKKYLLSPQWLSYEASETIFELIFSARSSWYLIQYHLLLPDNSESSESLPPHIFSSSTSSSFPHQGPFPSPNMSTLWPHYTISSNSCALSTHPSLSYTQCAQQWPCHLTYSMWRKLKMGNTWIWIFRNIHIHRFPIFNFPQIEYSHI